MMAFSNDMGSRALLLSQMLAALCCPFISLIYRQEVAGNEAANLLEKSCSLLPGLSF